MGLIATPSQTVGPFFSIGMRPVEVAREPASERLTIYGQVLDGDNNGVSDALIETWQAGPDGQYARNSSWGWGRVATDASGSFRFVTFKPGRVRVGDQLYAPHIVVAVFARGLLRHLVTRIYFADEPSNADDPILNLVPEQRRATLIARAVTPHVFEWNIVLQGRDETVFFEC
jgi:protocatechuate 3,4-dioxygenase alpha subunit